MEETPLEIIIRDPGLSPFQRLWGAVILRAVQDARAESPRAVRFFTDPGSHFETACSFLGWNPGRIRGFIKRKLKNVDSSFRSR